MTNLFRTEWWYGLASGYGTRPGRALLLLAFLLLGFPCIYYKMESWFFDDNYWKALSFSLGVATLQRPEVPSMLGSAFRTVVQVEAILGPAQIALFLLALRMRVRR